MQRGFIDDIIVVMLPVFYYFLDRQAGEERIPPCEQEILPHASNATVSVIKWMDILEFIMKDCAFL